MARDPELKRTQNDIPVTSFSVVWSEEYKDHSNILFLPCTAWRGTGEFVSKYFTKGQEIIVSGKLQTRKWQDKEGNNRSTIELIVDEAHFCGPKQSGNSEHVPAGAPVDVKFEELDDSDGELPF